jgi:hypothetical protein
MSRARETKKKGRSLGLDVNNSRKKSDNSVEH